MKQDEKLKHLKSLGVLLDSKIEGPFGIRFGLDALLGLVPVIGDFSTTLASLYIIAVSSQLGCSYPVLLRMVLNVSFENLVGAIPFLGNAFDFYWKANNKNVALLEEYLSVPKKVEKRSFLIIGLILFVSGVVLLGSILLTVLIFTALYKLIVSTD